MKVEKNISDNKWEGTPDDCDQLKLSRKMEAYHQDRNHQHCLCMYNRCKKTKEEKRRKNTKQGTKKEEKEKDQGTRDRCKKKKGEKRIQGKGQKKKKMKKDLGTKGRYKRQNKKNCFIISCCLIQFLVNKKIIY